MIQTNQFQDSFSEEIWATTYKDHKDNNLSDTFRRVAKDLAQAETTPEKKLEWEEKFYDLFSDFKGVAGGRIMANAGTEWEKTTYMNCYVGPLPKQDLDSIDGIFKVLVDQANTLKSEGGWGMDFSWIRPRGAFIGGIGVESPGSIKFMEMFDKSSEIVTAGSGKKSTNKKAKGKIRKGAMMGVLACWHPDVIEFITAKQTPGRLSKFNVSVNCTEDFMNKVNEIYKIKRNETTNSEDFIKADTWNLEFPDTTFEKYKAEWQGSLADWKEKGYPVILHNTISVEWLWNLIMESTYNRAEPGVLFLDRANEYNPLNYAETIIATNPCGEQTLAPGGVCCLGTMNLTQFVNADRTGFDLEKLRKYIQYMIRFLDNVNTISDAPLEAYKYSMINKRRIGCGVMGWGSALFMLKIRFGSPEAAALREEVISTYARAAYEASIDLAVEKGMFPLCQPELHAAGKFITNLGLSQEYMDKLRQYGIRNSAVLSQQPNGNGSIVANIVSGGIEPIFMPEYVRTVIQQVVPEYIAAVTPKYIEGVMEETEMFKWVKEGDEDILRGVAPDGVVFKIDRNRGLTKEVLCEDYGVRYLKALGEWDPKAPWAVTTTELTVNEHVEDLKGFARWTDSACSKTANIPNDYPFDDFISLYLDVYNTGFIKGFTTYRSGTMTSVLSAKDEATATPDDEEIILEDIKLPNSLPATLKTLRAEGVKYYLTIIQNESQTRPVALFVQTNNSEKRVITEEAVEKLLMLGRTKGIPEKHVLDAEHKISGDNNATKIARVLSLLLRHGVAIKNIVRCLDTVETAHVGSFTFHIKKFLSTFVKDGEKVEGVKCQECHSEQVVFQEGCSVCLSCGSSKCG
jgi:ribonucleoside-diphosphate reductase alpha chain